MSALRVTLLGSSIPDKKRLAEQLRSCDQTIHIFTPEALEVGGNEGPTFLLGPNGSHANDVNAERLMRSDLDRLGIYYQVLYGTADECLTQALQVIRSRLVHQTDSPDARREVPTEQPGTENFRWVWTCDKCSDPACEHQLLTGLLDRRSGRTTELLP